MMTRTLIGVVTLAVACAIAGPTGLAEASAPIKVCGAYGWDENGDGPRFMRDDEIVGAGL
jgi:hypothetical protein